MEIPAYKPDPTLQAADRALEERENAKPRRTYLGLSGIGQCPRKSYYAFYGTSQEDFTARTLKMFADGHAGEDVAVARLNMVEGLCLESVDPETGRQFEVVACEGHAQGHLDGIITGLLQAPKTPHVFECKVVNEKKLNDLRRLKREMDEKEVLRVWDQIYYAQVQGYMHLTKLTRSYHVVCSPGVRDWESVRTDYDKDAAEFYMNRAESIVSQPDTIPPRISDNPDYFLCRWCNFKEICHGSKAPGRDCRTCVFSEPSEGGRWMCNKHGTHLDNFERCGHHRYRPAFIDAQAVEVDGDDLIHKFADGRTWKDDGQ